MEVRRGRAHGAYLARVAFERQRGLLATFTRASMLDEVPFEVERALTVGGRPVVMARLLGPAGDFTVDEGATLDGRDLEPYLDIPRVPRPDGTLRRDLFGFRLRHARDLSQFEPGARVLLRTVRRPPPTGID